MKLQELNSQELLEVNGGDLLGGLLGGTGGSTTGLGGLNNLLGGVLTFTTTSANGGETLSLGLDLTKLFDFLQLNSLGGSSM